TSKIPAVEQMESLTVESEFPTVSSLVPTVFLDTSPETSSGSRLISKEVLSKKETPSLDNVLTLSNRFEDTIGVEVNLSNMESSIPASPAPTFRIHKDHPKSQIISLVDTPVQTRHKSKEMEEHSFIATIHQKTTPNLLHFYLFSCFLSQEEPKKIFDTLKDPDSKQRTHEFIHVYLVFASVYVWIGLAFCDYHNMIAILEKTKHNIDLHQIVDFIEASHIRQYTRRATWIAQSKALSLAADEPASLLRDNSQGEAFPTVSSLDAGQGRENIIKTTTLPLESSPKVTSLDADEGIMQQKLQELMDLYNSLQRQQTQMVDKIKDQDLEISGLKARVKILEDKERERAAPAQEDAPIKGGSMEIGEEVRVERSTELGSNDTEEIVNVLSAMEAVNILTSGVAAVSVSPVAAATTVGVSTVSGLVPNVSAIFTTASVVTPYLRRPREIFKKDKGKEKVRLSEQLARDSKIARLHDEEELKMVIEGLDRRNKMIAKHLHEYEQAAADLSIGEKIELINELEQREFYMSVLKSHAGWKTKHFRGMTLEEIKEKFIPVWKKIEDFVPMSSREKGKRMKRKGLKLDQGSFKRMKTSEDVSKEDLKGMMQLVPVEEVYVEALQVKHHIIDWEIYSEGKKDY
nr:hypothetical protein [Tanacetum cinerariifolium]